MSGGRALWRPAGLALASVTWLALFGVLRGGGSWLPFAVAGPALAAAMLVADPAARALVRWSPRQLGLGLVVGALMVLVTHAAFALVAPAVPDVRAETVRLTALVGGAAVPLGVRVGLLVLIAGSEEIVFRGALTTGGGAVASGVRLGARIAILAVIYALTTVTLGSWLLVACALSWGLVWGGLTVATRSVLPAVLAHAIWDVGVLIAWPLT